MLKKIPSVEWFQAAVLAAAAPFLLFPSSKTWWAVFCLPVPWLVRYIKTGRFSKKTVLDIPVLVLIFQAGATCFIVPDIFFSLPKIFGLILGVAVFYAVVNLFQHEETIPAAVGVFLGSGFVFSLVGILGISKHEEPKYIQPLYTLLKKFPSFDFRLPGAEQGFHPNALGGGLTLILPAAVVVFFILLKNGRIRKSPKHPYFPLFLTGLMLLFISGVFILTQSRSSFAGVFVTACLFGMTALRRFKIAQVGIPLVTAALILGFFMLAGSDKLPYTDLESKNKMIGRVETFWVPAVQTIKDHPLLGIGMNRARINPKVGYYQAHFHNHFLHTAAEMGLPALAAYLALLLGAGYMCLTVWKKSGRPWIRLNVLGLAGGQLAYFIFGFLDTIPLGAKAGLLFWVSLGLIAVLYEADKKRPPGMTEIFVENSDSGE